jgi:N-acetylneuraminic acid mutarotase
MKTLRYIALLMLITLLVVNCNEEEVTSRPYPRLKTLPVTGINAGGATFHAEILFRGGFDILRYGFVWSEGGNPSLNNTERRIFSGNIQSGSFSAEITTTLMEKFTYSVRSFVETDNYTVYGEIVDFYSLGSKAPQIISIAPPEGTVGDTMTIKGKNFSFLNQNNKVTFNLLKAITVSSSDTLVQVVVPDVTEPENKIVLNLAGNATEYPTPFRITTPVLESVTPQLTSFGDTLLLKGRYFSPEIKANRLFLGNVPAVLVSAGKNQLSFIVPANLNASVYALRLETGGRQATYSSVAIKPPVVWSVNVNRITRFNNGNLVISGDNFNPIPEKNGVWLGTQPTEVVSAKRNQITIRFPEGFLPNKLLSISDTLDIEVKVLGQSGRMGNAIVIDYRSTWTRMMDFPGKPRLFGASFAIGSKGYAGLGSYGEYSLWYNDFWEYDPVNDLWTRLEDFPGAGRSKFASFVIGNKAYIVAGVKGNQYENTHNLSEVWEFNGDTHRWSRKGDFPGGPRWQPFGFAVNGEGYVGGGVLGNYEIKADFWKYQPVSDSWEKRKDIGDLWKEGIFAISDNKNGYILTDYCGSPCNQRYFWRYDAAGDSWTHMQNMPGPYLENAGFVLNGHIYAGTGLFSQWEGVRDFYGYDPAKDQWVSIPFVEQRRTASSFAVGNFGYLFLGKSGSHDANKTDVWRFDPTKPEE